MNSSTPSLTLAQKRQADRFYAKNSDELIAELLILSNDEVLAFPVKLADISETGCAVRMSTTHSVDVSVAILRVRDRGNEFEFEVAGRLCWNQTTSLGANTVGFQFRRPVASQIIDQMVDKGWVTRRTDPRKASRIGVEVRRSNNLPAIQYATIEDYSMTGIRLEIDTMVDVGERLLVTKTKVNDSVSATAPSPDTASGSVTVKWVRPADSSIECGCVFQNLASSRAINEAFSQLD